MGYPKTGNGATPIVTNSGKLKNFDVFFNSVKTWTVSGTTGLDIQGIATHELGHVLGLGDMYSVTGYYSSTSNVPSMYAYSSVYIGGLYGTMTDVSYYFRTLTQDDINGKSYIASQIN